MMIGRFFYSSCAVSLVLMLTILTVNSSEKPQSNGKIAFLSSIECKGIVGGAGCAKKVAGCDLDPACAAQTCTQQIGSDNYESITSCTENSDGYCKVTTICTDNKCTQGCVTSNFGSKYKITLVCS